MALRFVLRWFAVGAPYPWFGFATRFKDSDGIVGAEFFKQFAASIQAAFEGRVIDAGLVDSLDTLKSDYFDPIRVHPLIREFYEYTSRFDMKVTIKWNPLVRPFGKLYQALVARRMQNLVIPLDSEELSALDSWLDLIDLERDGIADVRCWIRVSKDSRIPVYVGAYKAYRSEIDAYRASYVSVAFPLPGGNMTTVLTPRNLGQDGMMLTTRDRRSSEVGVYLLIPHQRSFTMLPAFGLAERFKLRPGLSGGESQIDVEHDCYWLGLWAFRMKYVITRASQLTPKEKNILQPVVARLAQ